MQNGKCPAFHSFCILHRSQPSIPKSFHWSMNIHIEYTVLHIIEHHYYRALYAEHCSNTMAEEGSAILVGFIIAWLLLDGG